MNRLTKCIFEMFKCIFSALVYHVPFFLQKFRYIHDIGVSQVERKNYDQRQAYFGSTSRSGGKAPKKVSLQVSYFRMTYSFIIIMIEKISCENVRKHDV